MEPLGQPSELLTRFAHGELDAFETLFRQFQREVYRWIVCIVRDPSIAEDLTIETFWRIYRARSRFDPNRSFAAWARRIATNAAVDHLRTVRPETTLQESSSICEPSDPGVQRDVRERMRRAFEQLPAKLKVVATLALIEEQPYQEIADALGISVAAVKVRQFRAVRQLRKNLRKLGMEP